MFVNKAVLNITTEDDRVDSWTLHETPKRKSKTDKDKNTESDSEMDDEMYDMSQLMYQDGILEDDISENARYHGGRRHRRARKSQHRYPHHTHQRRETEHSFADQGATHFGQ